MVPGLKKLYTDLGYATEFLTDQADYNTHGFWTSFDQGDFVGIDTTLGQAWQWKDTTWSDRGWVYIPNSCSTVTCKVHVAFHGCYGNATDFAAYTGYREFAANNNLIVVFPETQCWNMTGDHPVDPYWLTKDDLFVKAVNAIICRLTSEEHNNTCPKAATTILPFAASLLALLTISTF